MNKKGHYMISLVFLVLVFIFAWATFLGKQLAFWGQKAIVDNGLIGAEAFILGNLNLLIFLVLILFIMIFSITGGNR